MKGAHPAIHASEQHIRGINKRIDHTKAKNETPFLERKGLLDEVDDELGLGKLVDLAVNRAAIKPKIQPANNTSGEPIPYVKIRKTGTGN